MDEAFSLFGWLGAALIRYGMMLGGLLFSGWIADKVMRRTRRDTEDRRAIALSLLAFIVTGIILFLLLAPANHVLASYMCSLEDDCTEPSET